MKPTYFAILLFTALFFMASCKKFEAGEDNSGELITTLILKLSNISNGTVQQFTWEDVDGPGGNAPMVDSIVLNTGNAYTVSLEVWNNSGATPQNITEEIAEENEAHRFYYLPSTGSLIIDSLSLDENQMPLGLQSKWTTGVASAGTLNITLRHYPGTPPDKQISDPVNSPKSSTDIALTFNYRIL